MSHRCLGRVPLSEVRRLRIFDLMSKPLPEHVTRTEAAAVLRLSPRQVDRLARAGALKKTKLGASRSGFARDELDRYLQELNYGDKALGGAGGYASRLSLLVVDIPTDTPHDINQLAERTRCALVPTHAGVLGQSAWQTILHHVERSARLHARTNFSGAVNKRTMPRRRQMSAVLLRNAAQTSVRLSNHNLYGQ